MELMQSNAAQMATYGIVIGIPQLTLTLLANIETATKSDYGRKFCSAMHAIRKKYAYNHVHDATSLQTILTELAGADRVRALKDAPEPNATTGRSVTNSISFLNSMMNNDTTASKYTKSAYGSAPTAAHWRSGASLANASTRKPRSPSLARKRRKRRTRTKSQRRTHAPTARNTTARSPIALNRTNARGTRNIRDTASS